MSAVLSAPSQDCWCIQHFQFLQYPPEYAYDKQYRPFMENEHFHMQKFTTKDGHNKIIIGTVN